MKNRWLLNVGLALLVGALVLLAIYKPGMAPKPEGVPLTTLAPQAVSQIRLLRPKQAEIVLERAGDDWRLTAPRAARANGFRVNELARLATTPVKTRFPAVSEELAQYGLDQPLATVYLNDAKIHFGGMHPLGNELYVLYAGQVQLIAASALRAASASLDDLLSTSLLEDRARIVSLRLPGFSLKQNEQGAWVRTPEMKELSSDQLNRFVDEWRYARALSVAPYAGKPVLERVTITVAEGERQRAIELGVLATKPEFVVLRRDENLEYHFPEDIGASLMQLRPDEPEARSPPAARPAK